MKINKEASNLFSSLSEDGKRVFMKLVNIAKSINYEDPNDVKAIEELARVLLYEYRQLSKEDQAKIQRLLKMLVPENPRDVKIVCDHDKCLIL